MTKPNSKKNKFNPSEIEVHTATSGIRLTQLTSKEWGVSESLEIIVNDDDTDKAFNIIKKLKELCTK